MSNECFRKVVYNHWQDDNDANKLFELLSSYDPMQFAL